MDYNYFNNNFNTVLLLLYIIIVFTIDFSDKMIYLLILTFGLIIYLSFCKNNKIIENMENEEKTEDKIISKNEKIDELTERIKSLEEIVTSNEWSVYRTHEITKLKNILNIEKGNILETTTTTTYEPILIEDEVEPLSKPNRIEPMGTFDGLCIDKMVNKVDYDLVDDEELDTYLGSTIPLIPQKTKDGLFGPSVDGKEKSPKKMSIFGNNQTSISCCDKSPFFTSTGCICITDDQEKYINSRGGNHVLPEKAQCPL